ncbi:hypothetical protein ACVDG5_031080 [Mesorhizobium sp. ORM6]
MSAFGSRWLAAGTGATLFAPAFVGDVFAGAFLAGEVFVGEVFAVGLLAGLAVAAAFAAGAFLAGFASILAVSALAEALPCPSAAAGFVTALADTFTGAFDAFATRSSSTVLVRPSLLARAALASEMRETSSTAASMSIYVLPLSAAVQALPQRQDAERLLPKIFPASDTCNRRLSASAVG